MLIQTVRLLRRALRRIHAAIAAAKLRRLRNELLCRGHAAALPSTVPERAHRAQAPLILSEKWDF